jgi:hypothetical protein
MGPVNRAMLIIHAGSGVVADVDVQGINVPAGDVDVLTLTISVDPEAKADEDWYLVISSSTAPPRVVPIKLVDSDTSEFTIGLWYWLVIVFLVILVFFFLLLPRVARRGEESEEVPEPVEDGGEEPEPSTSPGPEEGPEEGPEVGRVD